jgi:hypothetical protein
MDTFCWDDGHFVLLHLLTMAEFFEAMKLTSRGQMGERRRRAIIHPKFPLGIARHLKRQ